MKKEDLKEIAKVAVNMFYGATVVALGITLAEAWKDLGYWLANKAEERKARKKEKKEE